MKNKIISFWNWKGGVGKTTSVIILANIFSIEQKVLIIDLDSQSNLSNAYGIYPEVPESMNLLYNESFEIYEVNNNLDIIPTNVNFSNLNNEKIDIDSIKKNFDSLLQEYDLIILDLSPQFDSYKVKILHSTDIVYIPMEANSKSISGLQNVFNAIEDMQVQLDSKIKIGGVYLNRYKKRTLLQKANDEYLQKALKNSDIKLFNTKISESILYNEPQEININKYYNRKGYRNYDFLDLFSEIIKEK